MGFEILDWVDQRRVFESWGGESGRPIRVFSWYPAQAGTGMELTRSRYYAMGADAVHLGGPDSRHELDRIRERLANRYELDEDQVRQFLDAPVAARLNAEPVSGRFPFVILLANPHSLSNLAEGLAREGLLVFSPARMDRQTSEALAFRPNPVSLDTDLDDLRFVYEKLVGLPRVHADRLGVTAFSSGTLSILLWQMQDLRAEAIVTIEGWEGFLAGEKQLRESPDYRPRALRVPFLQIEKAAEERNENYAKTDAVVDEMPFASRERIRFHDAAHGSFLSEQRAVAALTGDDTQVAIHDRAATEAMRFFVRHLADGEIATGDSDLFTRSRRPAAPAIPTQEELARMIERGQLDRAIEAVGEATDAFDRRVLRRVVSTLPRPRDRLRAYRWIATRDPHSAWAQVDVANACAEVGDTAGRQQALQAALERVDGDPTLDDAAKQRLRSSLVEELQAFP